MKGKKKEAYYLAILQTSLPIHCFSLVDERDMRLF